MKALGALSQAGGVLFTLLFALHARADGPTPPSALPAQAPATTGTPPPLPPPPSSAPSSNRSVSEPVPATPVAAPAAPAAAPPPPPAAKVSNDDEDDDDAKHGDKVSVTPWPSLLIEPGAGAIVAPAARGGATFGFSVGLVRLATRDSSTKIASILALHAGYTFAPLVDRGELTLTAGLGVSGPWALSLRGGPTIDTNGVPGFRAGLRGTLYHGAGVEVFTHHGFSPRNDTSVYMVLSIDLVPATLAVLFIGAFGGLFK
ncbi:MAG: hypothetical protein U0174_07575 [Polyangiaceae bacterium]